MSNHLACFVGWMLLGGKAEYKATDKLILEGAAGGFWTAEKTACPASLRIGSLTGRCGGPTNSSGEPALNFTGNSRVPRVAGQKADYLDKTLKDFKTKERNNSPTKTALLDGFSDDQLHALAEYLAGMQVHQ